LLVSRSVPHYLDERLWLEVTVIKSIRTLYAMLLNSFPRIGIVLFDYAEEVRTDNDCGTHEMSNECY
jgi:hypothetical protein